MAVKKKFAGALISLILLGLVVTSCGKNHKEDYTFNYKTKELKTNIKFSDFEIETVVSPKWGSGDGEVAFNPEPHYNHPEASPSGPSDLCINSEGVIFINDVFNARVASFTNDGKFLRNYAYPRKESASIAANKTTIFFRYNDGAVVSFDLGGSKVAEWNSVKKPDGWTESTGWYAGNLPYIGCDEKLYMIGKEAADGGAYFTTVTKWEDNGTPIGSFEFDKKDDSDRILTTDAVGNFYTIGDTFNIINVYDSEGRFINSIDIASQDITQDFKPKEIYIGSDGSFYMLLNTWYAYKYDSNGKLKAGYNVSETLKSAPGTGSIQFEGGFLYFLNSPSIFEVPSKSMDVIRIEM